MPGPIHLGYLRRPDGLRRLVLEVPGPGEGPPLPRQEELALAEAPDLVAAWRRLGSVRLTDEGLGPDLLTVLGQTLAVGEGWRRSLPDPPVPAPAPRATAAHPRAYRGTLRKPPRAPAADRMDLRPYLGGPPLEQALLAMLKLAPSDPYFARHHGGGRLDRTSFDEEFVANLLPCLRGAPASQVEASWNLFLSLRRLSRNAGCWPQVLSAWIGLLCLPEPAPSETRGWMEHLLALGPDHLKHGAELMLRLRMPAKVSPAGLEAGDLFSILETAPPADAPRLLEELFQGLHGGASFAYVESGLLISRELAGCRELGEVPAGKVAIETAWIAGLLERAGAPLAERRSREYWSLHLWRCCGELPRLTEVLSRLVHRSLSAEATYAAMHLLCSFTWGFDQWRARWSFLLDCWPQLLRSVEATEGAYQDKLLREMSDWFWDLEEEPVGELSRWQEGWPLLRLRASRPYRSEPCGAELCRALFGRGRGDSPSRRWKAGSVRDRLLRTDSGSWRRLERAGRRDADRRFTARGLTTLRESEPELVVSAFETAPRALFRASYWLGVLSRAQRRSLLSARRESRPAGSAVEGWSAERLATLLAAEADGAGRGFVPRALRQHLLGERSLTPAQVDGHRRRMLRALPRFQCQELEAAAQATLATAAPGAAADPPSLHALALLRHAEANRRSLRRLLRDRFDGGRRAERDHPLSRDWFRRHPKIDEERWLGGLVTEGALAGHGTVRIALERDLLEVLQLGTYVSSWLGLGGGLMYSAAAVALDVNKQVLYARDAKGAVLARQLVAISSTDRLFAYGVYPPSLPETLQRLFLDHDRRLAQYLDLPLVLDRDEDQEQDEVELILAREFWDDGLWEGPRPESS